MRNLWLFISKYNAFFLFVIFFVTSLGLFVTYNSFQRASVLNSSNQLIGQAYETMHYLRSYLHLAVVNDSLAAENARLKSQLPNAFYSDSVDVRTKQDTVLKQQYIYIVAQVVNNSIHLGDNFITINRGKRHGIEKGMGVISASGVVGIVKDVSANYATIQSLLHSNTRISASIAENNAFGSLVWGEENHDPRMAILKDIPNHVKVKRGQHVVTSGFSTLFPRGLPIGRIMRTGVKGGESFLDIEVLLSTDFSTLQYVYVVKNFSALEKLQLEAPKPSK
ncbi:rod shape-determining protein MreC [Pedobacter sp. SYSU D00535]|uniref:rod shape-determining protein MreC n=1 Tax=Pedobacter sp. SYSU D00535 TaxID=2810308 RepID=UPI001A95E575|nr:rod shape-determining protein MreC [Pedobacter sp. SYSU D00535]